MKYRVKETTRGDGTVTYEIQYRSGDLGVFNFLLGWHEVYERRGLIAKPTKTLSECLLLIAKFQQEDRDMAVKKTRYIAEGLDVITVVRDNKESNTRGV